MKVLIRKIEDETEVELEVSIEEHCVRDLKELIAMNNFGPGVGEQHLEYGGKRLEDIELLSSYEIEEGCVIILKRQLSVEGEEAVEETTAEES